MTKRDTAPPRRGERGQALVVIVVAMIPVLAMVGLIVDGGYAWSQQRVSQNGADAAAEAGAAQLARKISDSTITDGTVWSSVRDTWRRNACPDSPNASCDTNNQLEAYYTDFCGKLLTPAGTITTSFANAARVGSGFPANPGGPAPTDCVTQTQAGPYAGVWAVGHRTFGTTFARVVGIDQYTASTQATAVTGYLQQACTGAPGDTCPLMPVTFYQDLVTCTASRNGGGNSGFAEDTGQWYHLFLNTRVVLPICKNGPGNVGWLNFGKNGVGGPRGIVDCVYSASSSNPCIPSATGPVWWDIAQSGGTNSGPLETALNSYAGQVVLLPIFTHMCSTTPDQNQAATGPYYGCPSSNSVAFGTWQVGNSNPDWYRLANFAPFYLEHAYTNGNNAAQCNPAWSNPPADSKSKNCLIGTFVDASFSGQLGPTGPGAIGVQLIR